MLCVLTTYYLRITTYQAAIAVLCPAARGGEVGAMTWAELKAAGRAGAVPWGQTLFDQMAGFDAVKRGRAQTRTRTRTLTRTLRP